jgi:hypothetical protein
LKRRCDRNRKRSKRRAIYCPVHGCHLDSVSQKHKLFVDRAIQLQQRGVKRRNALMLIANQTAVVLDNEWLEAFWCEECQKTQWFHVQKTGENKYQVSIPPQDLWKQVTGVIDPRGNPSVGEFTRRQARMMCYGRIREFGFVR